MYGHIAGIHMSGKVKGSTSIVLRFDRLVMADGRRAPIHAEIVELYHAPSGEEVDVEGAIESGGRGGRPSRIPLSEQEPVPCWAESSVGQGSRDWVNCRRCARTRHYRIPWPSEDHSYQRTRNVDSYHRRLIPRHSTIRISFGCPEVFRSLLGMCRFIPLIDTATTV
jgi:hypothetical protein